MFTIATNRVINFRVYKISTLVSAVKAIVSVTAFKIIQCVDM